MSGVPVPASQGRVAVGVVGKPFGLRGGVYVRPDPDLGHDFAAGNRYHTAAGSRLDVVDRHEHGDRLVLRFADVDDREAAERLRGTVLLADRSAVELDDEWLWADAVVGAEVVDAAGDVVGVVEGLQDGPAHDYLVVARPDAGTVLVPAVDELVTIMRERVVVAALPGLLDPEDSDVAGARGDARPEAPSGPRDETG